MKGKKPKGFGKFDSLMRKLMKVKPAEMYCPTCGGTGEINDPAHPDHPNKTGDGKDETWCIDCDGMGTRDAYDAKLSAKPEEELEPPLSPRCPIHTTYRMRRIPHATYGLVWECPRCGRIEV